MPNHTCNGSKLKSYISGRKNSSISEASYPPFTVVSLPPALSSRPGPVFGCGEGVFHAITAGKYAFISNNTLPEPLITSSSIISASSHMKSKPANTVEQLNLTDNRSAIPRSTGRMQHSTLEASSPFGTVELDAVSTVHPASRYSHQSRPVPVPEIRLEVFQPATQGESINCRTISFPEFPLVCSMHRDPLIGHYSAAPSENIATCTTEVPVHTEASSSTVAVRASASHAGRFMSVYYQNVRGLRTKIVQLRLMLLSCEYDILVFTETWLREDIDSAEISSDYTIFRCDRSELTSQYSRGGGVLIATKNTIICEPISLPNCSHLEQVAIRVKSNHRAFYIIGIYLPPNSCSDLYADHAKAVQHIMDISADVDIVLSVGDFNLSNLRWQFDCDINGYVPSNISSEHERSLVETLFASGLQQTNSLTNVNGRLLDLVFVNVPDQLDTITPSTPLLPIDNHHAPFILLIDESSDDLAVMDDQDESCNFDFKACNYNLVNNALADIDWDSRMQSGAAVDQIVAIFYDNLYEVLNEHVPRKRRPISSVLSKPWWTSELRCLRNNVRKLRNRFFLSRTDSDRARLREVETVYKELLLSTHKKYISRIESSVKQNPSCFWDFVRKQKSSARIPCNVQCNGSKVCSNIEAANLFATFFESVFTNASPVFRCDRFNHIESHNITFPVIQFTVEDICKSLSSINTNKGSGSDGIPPLLLKHCCPTLASPISRIFNRSLQDRIFPSAWKKALIVPIHKSGSRNLVENYRGVSKLCCLSKVFEKLVHQALYNVSSSFILESQHGFMKQRSTTTNLMCYVSELSRNIEQRRQVDAVYIDFAKAFDTVPHTLLIDKMRHIGFSDWITEWLLSYLSNRKAHVVVNSVHSHSFNITSGVPQGSVLGPLLFNIFVNDLCMSLSSLHLSFADDLKLYRVINSHSDCVALQEDINVILGWCVNNGMRINNKKCKIISFTRCISPIRQQYHMDAGELERVHSICDLGVTIDSKLRFNEHVGIICARAFSVLGFIRRHASEFTDIYALKTLYCSLVRSILEYAAPVWAPYHVTQIVMIERVQKKFIRFALRQLPWIDAVNLPPYSDRCQLIKLEPLSARRVNMQCLFVFDLIKGSIDCPVLLERLPLNVPSRRFRNSPLLAIPYHRTSYGQHNPFDTCIRAFNTVSEEFDFNLSKNVFSSRIKNIVFT